MNKASGGDGIPAELLNILTDDAIKVQHLICQQIWKTQQDDPLDLWWDFAGPSLAFSLCMD